MGANFPRFFSSIFTSPSSLKMWLPEISLYHSVMGHPREDEEASKKKNASKDVDDDDSDTDSIGE